MEISLRYYARTQAAHLAPLFEPPDYLVDYLVNYLVNVTNSSIPHHLQERNRVKVDQVINVRRVQFQVLNIGEL